MPPFVLAMGEGADIAAAAGLPLVIGDLRDAERMLRGVERYRAAFRPSVWSPEPYVVISGAVAVAATEREARRLLVPEAWAMAYSRTHGSFPPLAPVERIEARTMTARERGFHDAACGPASTGPRSGSRRSWSRWSCAVARRRCW